MLLLAVGTAVIVSVLKLLPALTDTSLQDPAVNPEFWLLCGVFIAINCEKWQESALKTFVFFLVSQPLIYLIQMPFSALGWGIFQYYIYWFKITLLTPFAAVAVFLIRKKNWLSAVILAGGVGACGFMAAYYFYSVKANFPHHLLSFLFCFGLALFLTFALLEKKSQRLALILVLALTFGGILFVRRPNVATVVYPGEGSWTYTMADENVAEVIPGKDGSFTVRAKNSGSCYLYFTDASGQTKEYYVTVSGGGVTVTEFD